MAMITNSLCTNGIQAVLQSQGGALNIATAANATVLTLGNVTGASQVVINSGTAGYINTTTNGVHTVHTGTGAISISGDATNTTVGLATGAGAKLLTLGSATGASSVTINTGSAGLNIPSFTTSGALVSTSAGLITDATASTAGFILTSNGAGSAPSFQANAVSQGIVTLDATTGSATGTTVSIVGSNSNIVTSAASATLTIALANSPSVSGSVTAGTGIIATTGGLTATAGGLTVTAGTVTITPFASYGALVTNTSGVITDAAATAGYVLTGNSGSVPTFQAVTAIGAVTSNTTDSGTANPTAGVINMHGGSNINTSGATNVVTINLVNSPSVSGSLTAGTGVVATTGGLTATAGGLTVTAGTVTITPFATTGALVCNASGVVTDANANTAGFVLTSNGSGSVPTFQAAGASGFVWVNTTGATQAMAASTGYVSNDGATLVTFTLPATAVVGAEVAVQGSGSGLWTIAQNAGQTIHFNAVDSTTGVTGGVSSTSRYDSITLICNVANTDWVAYLSTGNLSVA